ncbi:a-pheromone processing metallopeptidase Ste23 [Metarhizium album ARSEF 1941]|uniref:A-pheromone processing metallopeptidase Ste23 n=1 Tax=Metarhizium album (strain ARSEF 1941) TaxID=1081103 RepID=A0A0B2WQ61_METAS|nr:a-pheromone processing metallopeptidase Ste23 [Metarhizium album ARSEF 1941]KHN95135.1 a-pheromone processing metallopeptidase Ste23 [Metarhizium album ARSEF 1941]
MSPPRSSDLATGRQAAVVLVTDRLEKPLHDLRDYRVVRLENELEVLLVHDPETDKASAALDVNVGNFCDPREMPGLAHGVEHLLFMGTAKFPGENEYGQYLSANSGSSNAYTTSTSTNYYFEVAALPANNDEPSATNPSPLLGALDRFAQFFIAPLFLENTVDRELQAVNEENNKNLQNDIWRLYQLSKSLANPEHPYSQFSTGNLRVLKAIPESRGINVREKFLEFHAKHYSANRMKLVVLGREPLDVLQKWVVELFSGIENKNLSPNRWTEEPVYREADLATQCFAKPVLDSRTLVLMFPSLDEETMFETQPGRYISHLVGHESPGSLMSYLKTKGWVNSISSGAHPGLDHYPQITNIFFQYVAMLRESPPQEWIFEEQKRVAELDFKFAPKVFASKFTSSVSSVMQKPLPREWLLSGQSRLRTFDPSLIAMFLEKLRPENMRLVVVSREFPGNWDETEQWYGTEYRYEKIPSSLMSDLQAAMQMPKSRRLPELRLPRKNEFIPDSLEVEKKEVSKPALAPWVLRNDQGARTWWKKDDTFWVPKAYVCVCLQNPIIFASAENSVKASLFSRLVQDALQEYSYDAQLAGLDYIVSLSTRGLDIRISGYNEKLAVLLKQVAITMRDLDIEEERFRIVHEQLVRAYENSHLEPAYRLTGGYLTWLNADTFYTIDEKAEELKHVTADAVRLFQKQILSQLYIEVYALGNLQRSDAVELTDMVESTLRPRPLPRSQWPIIRSLILPRGSNYVYRRDLKNPQDVNHCVETWFYVGEQGDRQLRGKTLLIEQMMREPAFDQLRTKEALGYVVFTGIRNFSTTTGLRLLIQSNKKPKYLDRRIETFLARFGQKLEQMSDCEFESHKRSLLVRCLEKLRDLGQEAARHWIQIESEYYDFELAQHDADDVTTLTKTQMVQFYKTFFHPSSSTRCRLSLHLKARGLDTKVVEILNEAGVVDVPKKKRKSLDVVRGYLKESRALEGEKLNGIISKLMQCGLAQTSDTAATNGSTEDSSAVETAQVITDVRQFKASLQASPGVRPIKQISEFKETDAKL